MAEAKKKPAEKKKTRAPKTAKRAAAPAAKKAQPKARVAASTGLSASVVGTDGAAAGKMSLPKELFGAKMNTQLMAQAVRVYLANQREGSASTQTRGEVTASTRKIWAQKGTGRARHGSVKAPIFVGGGIAFGPKPRDFSLKMPKKMRTQALASALTSKYNDGDVIVVDGFEKLPPKTKAFAGALKALDAVDGTLVVVSEKQDVVKRSLRNIAGVDVIEARNMHTYTTLSHKTIVVMKDALDELKKTFVTA